MAETKETPPPARLTGARRRGHRPRPSGAFDLQPLEARRLLSVSQDAEGFTVVAIDPGSGGRQVYVSTSGGSDSNNGLTPQAPVKTIAKGKTLLHSGSPDQLLLKRGDTWHESFGDWRINGKSASQPLLIGTYGTGARPLIESGTNDGFRAGYTSLLHDVFVQGLRFHSDGHDPKSSGFNESANPDGFRLFGLIDRMTIEDCEISTYRNNFTVQNYYGPINDFTVRRSSIIDAYCDTGSNSAGMYFQGVDDITLEGNFIDHNGWYEGKNGAGATIYNHNLYVRADCTGLVVRGNVISRGSSYGLQARSGGIIENNLFKDNATALAFGMVSGSPITPGGVVGRVVGNVFTGKRDINSSTPRGVGIEVSNIKAGAGVRIADNLFLKGDTKSFAAISLNVVDSGYNSSEAVGINDLTIENNVVYSWAKAVVLTQTLQPGGSGRLALNRLTVRNNDFQQLTTGNIVFHGPAASKSTEFWSGNRYQLTVSSSQPFQAASKTYSISGWQTLLEPTGKIAAVTDYADSTVTLDKYSASFLTLARKNNGDNWDPSYTADEAVTYLKAGFNLAAQAPDPPQDPGSGGGDPDGGTDAPFTPPPPVLVT